MQADEDAVGEDALSLLDDVEADKRHLHGENGPEDVEGGVRDVETVGVSAWGVRGEGEAYGRTPSPRRRWG